MYICFNIFLFDQQCKLIGDRVKAPAIGLYWTRKERTGGSEGM